MVWRSFQRAARLAALAAVVSSPALIADPAAATPKHLAPIPAETLALMAARNTTPGAPILMRLYKKESEIEVWKQARDGRYVLLKSFPICRWSGQLGPKTRMGDRQAPEGFYTVAPRQMNPNSAYHLSFNLGYPNAYDRAHGATGSHLMVHGACSSAGCYAMTDVAVQEIFALAREAFAGGQQAFQFQAYPFRMTAQNMARYRSDPNMPFWRQLKEGSDRFEATGLEPRVAVADARYVFPPFKDPAKESLAVARRSEEEARVASLIAEGSASTRVTYADGGQHAAFTALLRRGISLGEVSRPEALAWAGREVIITPARPKPTAVAAAPAPAPAPAATTIVAALEAVQTAAIATSFGFPNPLPLNAPPLFGQAPLVALGGAAGSSSTGSIRGSVRILAATLTAARFEVAARF